MVSLEKQYPDDVSLIAKEEIQKKLDLALTNQSAIKQETGVVWMLTTYTPKECGIATFSQDLREAVGRVYGSSIEINIAVIDNKNEQREYPDEAGYIFNAEDTFSYSQFSSGCMQKQLHFFNTSLIWVWRFLFARGSCKALILVNRFCKILLKTMNKLT
jgi:hypothetical protein